METLVSLATTAAAAVMVAAIVVSGLSFFFSSAAADVAVMASANSDYSKGDGSTVASFSTFS